MSQDAYWSDVTEFLQKHLRSGEHLLAPPRLKAELSHLPIQVSPYYASQGASLELFDWILVHKGMIGKLDRLFLQDAVARYPIVFANEVFVILAKSAHHLTATSPKKADLQPLWDAVGIAPSPRFPKLKKLLPGNATAQQLDLALRRLASLDEQVKNLEAQIQKRSRISNCKAIATLPLQDFTQICRNACQTTYLGDRTVLCRVLGNYMLYADSQDISLSPHLCHNGYWEPGVTYTFARVIQPGWHCIDVGANHGYFSLIMASIVGKTGKVLALEANPNLARKIEKTLIVNGLDKCTTVSTQAAADSNGEPVILAVPKEQMGGASIARSAGAGEEAIATTTATLDTLTADWGRVDFIKIDTEGAEEGVWRGMRQIIKQNPQLIVVLEFGATRYADARGFLQDILNEGFILRYINGIAEPKELTIDRCLTERGEDHWDLYLSRH
jgi:FkbM family methyltransferase